MAVLDVFLYPFHLIGAVTLVIVVISSLFTALIARLIYNVYFHPLSRFPGPWYAAATSLSGAIISVRRIEHKWLMSLVNKYGTSTPIRISPTMLLFPKPSALREIYWDPRCNQKSRFYGAGVLGPPHLFTTLDPEPHRVLRKALSNAPWSAGQLKKTWEPRIDSQVRLLISKLRERALKGDVVCLSDKVAEFAADIMTMISFTTPFGFVQNGRDEKNILSNWRNSLDYFGFVSRYQFFRDYIMTLPVVNMWMLPQMTNESGTGWLMCEADRQVTAREELMSREGGFDGEPDFLQYCLDAKIEGKPLSPVQKRAHVTLLIQAGADTTGTALGCILRFLLTHPSKLSKAIAEIEDATRAGKIPPPSSPADSETNNPIIQYEQTRLHLPYIVACIKEGLRLNPPASNLMARVAPSPRTAGPIHPSQTPTTGGSDKERDSRSTTTTLSPLMVIDGIPIPPGTEMTSNAYVVQRDAELYAPDPEAFRPERWLEINPQDGHAGSTTKGAELDAASLVFGMGPRVCIGKDISFMEMYKVVPELLRNFEMELVNEGRYILTGGVSYNKGLMVKLGLRGA